MARAKKIGHVNRQKGTMVYVDKKGDVYEMPMGRRRKK